MERIQKNATDIWIDIQVENIEGLDVGSITAGAELCFVVAEKVKNWKMVGLMFGAFEEGDLLVLLEPKVWTWPKLLAHLECFPSASQAAKYLKDQSKALDFEKGFTDLYIEENRKIQISLWNPYSPEML